MPVLECTKKRGVIKVDTSDLDRFIEEALGKEFNFAYREEMSGDSSKEIEVSGGYCAKDIASTKQKIDEDFDHCSTEEILDYCASIGLIDAGSYIVKFND